MGSEAAYFLLFLTHYRATVYNVHATAKLVLSHSTGATTIRGYCRHFTAQWRERVAHASGHKYREALTHTNKSMHAYANTQMNTF